MTGQPPRGPQPYPDSSSPGSPPPEPPRPNRLMIGIATVTTIAVIVGVTLFVVFRPGGPEPVGPAAAPTALEAVPAPRGTTRASPTSQAVTESDLLDQVVADRATAERMVGYWVPQISSKQLELTVNGTTYDHEAIFVDFRSLDARFPQSFLVSSNDYSSFRQPDFWVTLVAVPFGSADAANVWCDTNGFAKDDCFAKRLSHTEGPDGNTRLR
ncbi:MAG: zinc ribbon domain-containing protein [Pseudonocardia sp.]